MEWVVITGSTVAEARERALDHLGVDETEVEIEILDEPGGRLFWKTDARVRARIAPRQAPAKRERRRGGKGRGGSSGSGRGGGRGGRGAKQGARTGGRGDGGSAKGPGGNGSSGSGRSKGRSRGGRGRGNGGDEGPRRGGGQRAAVADVADQAKDTGAGASTAEGTGSGQAPKRRPDRDRASGDRPRQERKERAAPAQEVSEDQMQTLEEQVEVAEEFLEGLVDAFGLSATIERNDVDDELVELQVLGDDLGLLIGRRGSTVQAVNEVLRTGLQRRASGTAEGRVRADIGRYRERRREALARFAAEQAAEVLESGEERALEPMNSADRKVVHDAINEIDGVETLSEGAEPRRWVVIAPID